MYLRGQLLGTRVCYSVLLCTEFRVAAVSAAMLTIHAVSSILLFCRLIKTISTVAGMT
jgi:hypothetical protein